MMTRIFTALTMLILILTACGASPTTNAPQTSTRSGATPNSASSQPNAQPNAANPTAHQAALKEIQNDVKVRASSSADYTAAQTGMIVPVGGSVQTGDKGRARVDLLPDGTIIRIGPNSLYTVTDISTDQNGKSSTHIKLDFGQIWVLLKGGQLQVETLSGVASVRGSLLGVKFDPKIKKLEANCLEGHCGLKGNQGNEIELTDDQSSTVTENQTPSDPAPMTEDEITQWVDENPDAIDFFDGQIPEWLPTPDPSFNPYQEIPTNIPVDIPTDIPPTP